jgi:NAD-dependent dihydropyrimidine dehydrogenase PreA subunit
MEDLLFFDPMKCVDCRICELVCSFETRGGFNPRYSCIRIFANPATGISTVNISKECSLCRSCEENCPTHALKFSPDPGNYVGSGGIGMFVKRGGDMR